MRKILIRNIILSAAWFVVVIYLIATKNPQYAVALFPSILALWIHNGREIKSGKKKECPND